MSKRKTPNKLEGEDLLESVGHEALERLARLYKLNKGQPEGSHETGFRFQEEVWVAQLSWRGDVLTLKVWSLNPQTGNPDLRLDHHFLEGLQ